MRPLKPEVRLPFAHRFTPVLLAVALLTAIKACSDLPSEPSETLEDPSDSATVIRVPSRIGAMASRDCRDGLQRSGAIYRICLPEPWNGDLVAFAHGYESPLDPLEPADAEIEGTSVSEIVNQLGFGFASSSYRKNGLAVQEGIEDLVDAVSVFTETFGRPHRVYVVGVSEGGIVTALAVERMPETFAGGLAACGPIGDFRAQINYFGDFRVIFDYFFPGVIPGSPVSIPAEVQENWERVYVPAVKSAIAADPSAARQLLNVTRAPVDPLDPATVEATAVELLRYNVFGTNDAREVLGGQPYGNIRRFYFGSRNDLKLNLGVRRFRADGAAVQEIESRYQTSGDLDSPVVTLHTTADRITPYWHEPLYRLKTLAQGSTVKHLNIPVLRYGHCSFEIPELLAGFAIVVLKASFHNLLASTSVLPEQESQARFLELAHENGADPIIAEPVPASE